jgi:hypothetical protein
MTIYPRRIRLPKDQERRPLKYLPHRSIFLFRRNKISRMAPGTVKQPRHIAFSHIAPIQHGTRGDDCEFIQIGGSEKSVEKPERNR